MKYIKKLAALITAAVLCIGLVGCHPKNEVALTIGDIEYTSAFYMCALMQANGEAKQKVDEAYEKAEKDATDINYYKEKIDDKKFVDWVEDRAVQICRTYAYIETMCEKNNVEISEEELSNAEFYVDSYWNYYGYDNYFGANGVGYDTFKEFFTYSNLMQTYFLSIYGKGGTKALTEDEVKSGLEEKFVLADILTVPLTDNTGAELSTEQKVQEKAKVEGYKTRLDKGEDFKTIYEEVNGKKDTSSTDETTDKPEDELAQVLGSDDTDDYASDYYEDVRALQLGETKIIEDKDSSQILLVLKKDIMADPYYLSNMYDYIVNLARYEDFVADCEEKSKELEFEQNKFATNRFNVKKIKDGSEEE